MDIPRLFIDDYDFAGKRVFVRLDLNLPIKRGIVSDPSRAVMAVPTIKHIIEQSPKSVVLASHLGRPKGKVNAEFSLSQICGLLSKLLGHPIQMLPDCVGEEVEAIVNGCAPGTVFLAENLRFHAEETGKKAEAEAITEFRRGLRALADVFVNDAFGTSHRAHSSMVGEFFDTRMGGFLLKKEIDSFGQVLNNPAKPYLAIVGGAKVSDKILLIKSLSKMVDKIIIGGGMAYTFLKVINGMEIGKSLFDAKGAEIVPEIMATCEENGTEVIFPVDFLAADDFSNDANTKVCTVEEGIPENWEGLDMGPASRELVNEIITSCKTVVNNGPMGVAEFSTFAEGTRTVLRAMATVTKNGGFTVIGGGDSASICRDLGLAPEISFISTGGGASLELLQGVDLPGIVSLSTKN
ncbi:hypothetical protein PCE1_000031 [Barthelona sp. PCE]